MTHTTDGKTQSYVDACNQCHQNVPARSDEALLESGDQDVTPDHFPLMMNCTVLIT